MAIFIRGNSVANATSYELLEKKSYGSYVSIDESNKIDFDMSAYNLSVGEHIFVVRAKASGYEESDYSNEVRFSIGDSGTVGMISASINDMEYVLPSGIKWYEFVTNYNPDGLYTFDVYDDLGNECVHCSGTPMINTATGEYCLYDDTIQDGAVYYA